MFLFFLPKIFLHPRPPISGSETFGFTKEVCCDKVVPDTALQAGVYGISLNIGGEAARSRKRPREAARSREKPLSRCILRFLAASHGFARLLAVSRGLWRLLAASTDVQ